MKNWSLSILAVAALIAGSLHGATDKPAFWSSSGRYHEPHCLPVLLKNA